MNEKQAKAQQFAAHVANIALTHRLARAQRESKNYPSLEKDVELFWEDIWQCYAQQDWERLIAFREALQSFFDLRGYWHYSLSLNAWVEEAAKAHEDRFNEARWTHDHADILNQQGDYREAEQLYQKSEHIYRSLDQPEWALKSRHMRSMVVRAQGRTNEARQLSQSTMDEARQLHLEIWLAHPLYVLALLTRDQGNIQQAVIFVEESLALLAGTDEIAMIGQCLYFLGEAALQQKQLEKARGYLEESLQRVQQAGIIRREIATKRLLGELEVASGNYSLAMQIYNEILKTFEKEQFDDKSAKAQTIFSKAILYVHLKQPLEAIRLLEVTLAIYKEIGNVRRVIAVSLVLLRLYIRHFHWLRAGKLLIPTCKLVYTSGLLQPRVFFGLLRR
ncbi:MAG TPA: tetratricopeptide repeat protein [Ktedonobacteraceae bacterium]|jgi:tetratricopeptide (TPR) repeat protein|nr:tetratricopeptide repeat protein [Ktedonobacteraceae bacterium]